MKYDLKRPCPQCPFRTDCLEEWQSRARAAEIAHSLTIKQSTFACHETTEAGGSDGPEQHCAGALLVLNRSGEQPPQNVRIAERLGMFDPSRLDQEAPVFDSLHDFIEHHTIKDRDPDVESCGLVESDCLAPAAYATPTGGAVEAVVPSDVSIEECIVCGTPLCENCGEELPDGRRKCPAC